MNIKQRTVLSIGVPLAVLAAVISVLFQTQLLDEFKNLERARVEKNVYRVLYAIDNVRDELLLKTVDWGQWDDTYQFIANRNMEFVESTFTYDTLAAIKVRHAILFNSEREVVSGYQLDYDKETIGNVDPAELQQILAQENFFAIKSHQDKHASLLLVGDQYLLIAAVPIVDSKREAEPRGLLIFTQPVTEDLIAKVSNQTQVPVQVQDVRRATSWADNEREALRAVSAGNKPATFEMDDKNILGFGLVRDAAGTPALLVKVPQDRDIYQQGLAVRNYLVSGLLVSTGIALVASLMLFHSAIIKRLQAISGGLAEISQSKDFSHRVTVTGQDELSALATDLNSMLGALEEANKRTHEALTVAEQANRSKSTFIAKVSHELRTPISSIIGMLRILLKQEESDGKRAYISMANSSAYGLLDTINEILDFSKAEAGRLVLESIDFKLRTMMTEALYAVAPRVEEKGTIELLYDISPDVPDELIGDPLRLKQCIVNLLGNAAKFTTKGSVTALVYAQMTTAETVHVCFDVIDTGVGIPEDRLTKIFDPFTQADDSVTRVFSGTGLGLTIVKQTVEAMGGSVNVTSTPNVGSTFSLRVPLRRANANPRMLTCPFPNAARIVVIDGNSAAAKFMAEKFSRFGLVCDVVDSGQVNALTALSKDVSKFKLVVVTSEAVKRSSVFDLVVTASAAKSVPLVVVLSPFEIGVRERLVALGVPFIVTRPISVEDILRTVAGGAEGPSTTWVEDHQAALTHERKLKVLVVDDAQTNRIILSHMLEDAGHSVTCLENGLDLFNLMQRAIHGDEEVERFDVVLTDVQMPLMDGITATRKIRELEQEVGVAKPIPIFAVTAHAMREETDAMKSSGVNGVITKPIEPKRLAEALREVAPVGEPSASPALSSEASTSPVSYDSVEAFADLVRRIWTQMEVDEQRFMIEGEHNDALVVEQMLDVQDIYTRMGDSVRRCRIVLKAFSDCFKDQLTQLVEARQSGDAAELQSAAHALKGLLLDIGAKRPAALASRIEALCKKGDASEGARYVTSLSEQILVVARLVERTILTIDETAKSQVAVAH